MNRICCHHLGVLWLIGATFFGSGQILGLTFQDSLKGKPTDRLDTVSFSPDGSHLYAVGDGSTSVFERDAATGSLSLVEIHYHLGPGFPRGVTVSPDGRNVYVAIDHGLFGALEVYERSLPSGRLERIQTLIDGDEGVDGLRSAAAVAVSSDGRFVYTMSLQFAISPGTDLLAVFARDEASGRLTFVEAELAVIGQSLGNLGFLSSLVLSADGEHLYVSNFRSITLFAREAGSGALSYVESLTVGENGLPNTTFTAIVLSPDGRHLYAVQTDSTQGDGSLGVFDRQSSDGTLTYRGEQLPDMIADLGSPEAIVPSADGRQIYTASFAGTVGVFSRDVASGSLQLVELQTQAEHGAAGLDGAFEMGLSPDGSHVYSFGGEAFWAVFERQSSDGALSYVGAATVPRVDAVEGFHFPYAAALSPDGDHLYFVGLAADSIVHLARRADGSWRFVEALINAEGGVEGLDSPRAIAVSPDGFHVYAVSDRDNTLVTLARDPTSGSLTFLQALEFPIGGGYGRDFNGVALSPDGRYLYIIEDRIGLVGVLARDSTTGAVTFVDEDAFDSYNQDPTDLAPSPDGRHLYVASDVGIFLLDLDPDTGALSLRERFAASEVNALQLSADGRFLLAVRTGLYGTISSLQVWERSLVDGSLTLLEEHFDGQDGVEGLAAPRSVALAADGRRVYVVGRDDNALAVFDRDPERGSLSFVEALIQGEGTRSATGGVDGLVRPEHVLASNDNRSVYVLDTRLNAVSTFHVGCIAGPRTLCLNQDRFRVEADWRDPAGQSGPGEVVPVESNDSGLFWFFSPDNWELLVKVLDGCDFNERFWVFASATTDVEYTLQVTDTRSGETVMYLNPLGTAAPAITDTNALATCP
ncbi:MAG: beta-propeller fold lactonase family protein [Acidobacteriota bacterium]